MSTAAGYMSFAVGTYAQVTDDYAAAFGFSGENCYSMGENTVNLCTKTEGLYHNGIKLNSIDYTNENYNSETSVLAGGSDNVVDGTYSVVAGGQYNTAKGKYISIAGGYKSISMSNYGTVSGGFLGKVKARFGTVVG